MCGELLENVIPAAIECKLRFCVDMFSHVAVGTLHEAHRGLQQEVNSYVGRPLICGVR